MHIFCCALYFLVLEIFSLTANTSKQLLDLSIWLYILSIFRMSFFPHLTLTYFLLSLALISSYCFSRWESTVKHIPVICITFFIFRARWLREIGLVGREYKRWFYQKPKCDSNSQGFVSVRLLDFYPVLLVLIFGMCSAMFFFVGEVLFNFMKTGGYFSRFYSKLASNDLYIDQ